MPLKKPVAGSDAPRPLKTEQDLKRYTPTPRRESLPAPSVGIFDAPTRCLKINLEWWSHISGMIDTLSSEELWEGDSEEQARALSEIAALLAYNECEDSVTPEEYEEASYNAMYRAVNDVAKQIVSGRITNISVGEDGEVSDPTTGGGDVELPEDDPTTPAVDESLAAAYGGSYAVMKALELLYDKLDSYYGATNGTPITPEAQAQFNIKNLFPCDTTMDSAITNYYSYRATNGQLAFTPTTANVQYFYCHGSDERAWTQFLVDVSGFSFAKQVQLSGLSLALEPEFWSSYYNRGTQTPSTDYLDASCVKAPTEIGYITTLGVAFISQTGWKDKHRIRITAEGYFTDVDGDTLDAWWYIDPPAVPANRLASNNTQVGSNTTKPSLSVVPYNSAHKYVWTMDNFSGSAADYRLTISSAGMNTPTSPTSGIKVTVEDLGEIGQL